MYHFAHQYGLVDAKRGLCYHFPNPDTSVCLILGSGDSGAWCFFSWPSDFPSVPFILTYMFAFNTHDSSIPLWTSEKHFPSHFRNSQSSSHFKSRPPSSYWVFLRDLRNLRAKLKVKKVIKNRLDVFLLQWALETPRLGESSVCCPKVNTQSP